MRRLLLLLVAAQRLELVSREGDQAAFRKRHPRQAAAGARQFSLGDYGPLTEANLQELGRVDILMMPIAKDHILKEAEIQDIRKALRPRILIPMHYRIPDLDPSGDTPQDAASLLPSQVVVVFPHSPKVAAAAARR